MITETAGTFWSYMWQLHYQVKDILMIHKWIRKQVIAFQAAGGGNSGSDKVVGGVSLDEIIPTGGSSPGEDQGEEKGAEDYGPRQRIGLFLGPLLFILALIMPTPEGMSPDAQRILAGTIWMAAWWITEAIPIPVTSLLPIVLFPITGAMSVGQVTAPYANSNVFLFLGGFMIAICMEKWNLHRRIALVIINLVGTSPNRLILGFMVATGFLSMWISNTATTMMMLPIGLAIAAGGHTAERCNLWQRLHNHSQDGQGRDVAKYPGCPSSSGFRQNKTQGAIRVEFELLPVLLG